MKIKKTFHSIYYFYICPSIPALHGKCRGELDKV